MTATPEKVLRPVAIGARLKKWPGMHTLGFKPNFSDYSHKERDLILRAPTIYYPTAFYADLFNTMGKKTFPSFHTYKYAQDKIKQTALFQLLKIPHPKTRVFYGAKQKQTILEYFDFPFVAKIARGSAKGEGVFLIRSPEELGSYLELKGPAYIQEYLPIDRDMRLVIIGNKIRLAFWRIAPSNGFLTNISQGGDICFEPLPKNVYDLALDTAVKCGWNDVGIDIVQCGSRFFVLEGNMKYGTKGFQKAGINYRQLLASLIENKEI